MSKKQRRLKRRIRHNERKAFKANFKFDVHHICWQRRKWGHGYAKKLREQRDLRGHCRIGEARLAEARTVFRD